MKKFFITGIACVLLGVLLLGWFYEAIWIPSPDKHTQQIDVDASLLSSMADVEMLPAEKVHPGTFWVKADFKEMSGGTVAYSVSSLLWGSKGWLTLERWVSRGNGIFNHAVFTQLLPSPQLSHGWLYSPKKVIWTGADFQVVFAKDQGGWVFAPATIWLFCWLFVLAIILSGTGSRNKLFGKS